MPLEAKDIRLSECFVVGALDFETEYVKPAKQRIRIDTEVPDERPNGELVEVRCVYEREINEENPDDGETGWRIAMLVQMSGADADTSVDEMALVAIETSHPYVRQLLLTFNTMARNPTLSLPVTPPSGLVPIDARK